MHPPAVAVTRLLYGTGLGLLLGGGLGLQSGRSLTAQPPVLAGILALSGLFLLLGWLLSQGKGPLAPLFSNESDEAMAQRVMQEMEEIGLPLVLCCKHCHPSMIQITLMTTAGIF